MIKKNDEYYIWIDTDIVKIHIVRIFIDNCKFAVFKYHPKYCNKWIYRVETIEYIEAFRKLAKDIKEKRK